MLLKHKMLIAFMRRHGHEVFAEVRAAYIETLSKVLSSHFRAYLSAIERLEVKPHQHYYKKGNLYARL